MFLNNEYGKQVLKLITKWYLSIAVWSNTRGRSREAVDATYEVCCNDNNTLFEENSFTLELPCAVSRNQKMTYVWYPPAEPKGTKILLSFSNVVSIAFGSIEKDKYK
uniref:Reelin domain-containing protein n=1 Tax=Romanomermis culicivorax TaxID=13658 RepID=A0A915I954_ROMCU